MFVSDGRKYRKDIGKTVHFKEEGYNNRLPLRTITILSKIIFDIIPE